VSFTDAQMSSTLPPHMTELAQSEAVVARVGEILPGETKKFLLLVDGREEECFAVNHGGELCAYVNRCCHVPMSLDWIENQFFTEDGQFIQCATHGACYVPETGECISGPPCGKFLTAVPLVIEGVEVVARAAP
jgi:nitrite reductase/ring-hydroxylating ferredoxin subunit